MMEFPEKVHSDDESYEFINFSDYDMDQLNTKAINMDPSNDFLSSDLSDTRVLNEEEEASSNTTDSLSSDLSDTLVLNEEEEASSNTTVNDDQISAPTFKSYQDLLMAMAYDRNSRDYLTIKQLTKTHILPCLPAKSLARCQLVSKEWCSWISTPFFKHSQSQLFSQTSGFFQDDNRTISFISLDKFSYGVPDHSLSFLPKPTFIKSSCNGLLLCQSCDGDENYVCNPANKQWIQLPNHLYFHGKEPKSVLAFEPSPLNCEPCYKVICPFSIPGEGPTLYFDIYDSETKSWKTSDEICVDLYESDIKSDGIFVNGVVYWETKGRNLLAFDLKNEMYGIQTLPEGSTTSTGALSKVNGEICYVKGCYRNSDKMCALDVYHGGLMSSKHTISFGVPNFDDFVDRKKVRIKSRVLGYSCDDVVDKVVDRKKVRIECRVLGNSCGDVVGVFLNKGKGQLDRFFVYHVKDGAVEGPLILGCEIKLFPYVNSLVSIAV